MTHAPDGFRHHKQLVVRYGDLDRLSHVNNAKYLTYIEYGRLSYFRELGLWDGGTSAQGVIVAKTVVEYKLPLSMEDGTVDVWTRCSRLGGKSFDLSTLILRSTDGAVAANGLTTVVAYDYLAGETIAIPDSWRDIVRDYEPGTVG